jgi:acyl carrier protein
MTRAQFAARLVDWINARLAPPGVGVGPETGLFASGLLDSLRVLELIAWTERALGQSIPDERIRMDYFRSAARIAEVFIPEAANAG